MPHLALGLLLLLVAALLSRVGMAAPAWVVRQFGSVQGLPVGSATTTRIDADGFLWIATHDGLARFDGSAFEIFDSARVPALTSNRFVALHQDRHRRVYARAADGSLWRVRRSQVEPVRTSAGIAVAGIGFAQQQPLCFTLPRALACLDDDGVLQEQPGFATGVPLAAALSAGLDRHWLVGADARVWWSAHGERRQVGPAVPGELPARLQAEVGPDGDLWLARVDGLLRVDADGSWQRIDWPAAAMQVVQLRFEEDGSLWLGSDAGVYRLPPGAAALAPLAAGQQAGVLGYSWRAPQGQLWHSADGRLYCDGVLVLASRGVIQDLQFDAEGSAWASTLRDGLVSISRPRAEVVGASERQDGANFYGVDVDAGGTVWAGTLGGGLRAFHPDGTGQSFGLEQGLPGPNAWVVAAAPDGDILAATYKPGLYRLRAGTGRFEAVELPGGLAQAQVFSITFRHKSELWLGTSHGLWRQSGQAWQRLWPGSAGAVLHARDGSTWIGATPGLWRLHAGRISAVAPQLLAGIQVRGLLQDQGGAVWAATSGRGLVRIAPDDGEGQHAVRLGREQGLPSNSPHALYQDGAGNFWVNSNQGVFRILGRDLQALLDGQVAMLSPLVLGAADGLLDLEGNGGVQPALAADRQGRLWLPSQSGLVRVDPQRLLPRTAAPTAVIDGIEVDGRPRTLDALGALAGQERRLLLRFGAADLRAQGGVRFRYRLLPGEAHWIEAGRQRSVVYSALAPGAYRFELLACNGDGVWSTAPTVVEFAIEPAWHETSGFRLGLAAGIGLLVAALVRLRLRVLRRQAGELQAEVAARTAEVRAEKLKIESALGRLAATHEALALSHREVEDRNRRLAEQAGQLATVDEFRRRLLADVSHELRSPLMLIALSMRELDAHRAHLPPAEQRMVQQGLKHTQRMGDLVEQLIVMVRANASRLQLHIRRIDLVELLREAVAARQVAAAHAAIELRQQLPTQPVLLYGDAMQLQTVIGNLLDNALRHAGSRRQVSVELVGDGAGENARVTVADDGPGFEPALAERLFDRYFQASADSGGSAAAGLGIGLALSRELVELHGGRMGAVRLPQGGAGFWFELPLGSAHFELAELDLDAAGMAPAAAATAAVQPAPARTRSEPGADFLCLVEDNQDLAAYLAERLADYAPVQVCATAEEALARLQGERPALLVTDLVLPGRTGLELARALQDDPVLAQVPVVLMSAREAHGPLDPAALPGIVQFLRKPFTFEALLAAIATAWPEMRVRIEARQAVQGGGSLDPLLEVARAALHDPDFGVVDWASRVHTSERQLRRRVVQLTGMPPQAWLREQRLQKVRHLVSAGLSRTLAQAGSQSGIDNPKYLYRLYRARFGETESC